MPIFAQPEQNDTVTFENYDDKSYGYLRILVNAQQLRIEYHPASDGATTKTPDELRHRRSQDRQDCRLQPPELTAVGVEPTIARVLQAPHARRSFPLRERLAIKHRHIAVGSAKFLASGSMKMRLRWPAICGFTFRSSAWPALFG